MCKKRNSVVMYPNGKMVRIDDCLWMMIYLINKIPNYKTLACCCGHGKYPLTVILQYKDDDPYELFTRNIILRKKRFYRKDKQGYYYIPEVVGSKE